MKLNGTKKVELENSIGRHFIGYTLNANAPQGQNCFSCNYVLEKDYRKFLLKILLKNKIKGQVNKEQALAEVSIYKTVSSPYVLSLVDTKEDENYIFLLFPLLEGGNLAEYIKSSPLSENNIIEIGVSILRGIADLWRKNIVHQDLKPENIFIQLDGSVKILDFGSARFQISPFRGEARRNFAYSSPEQILASRPGNAELLRMTIDDRIDVYAVGLILYRLIEGRHPFEGSDFPAEAIFAGNVLPPLNNEGVSDGLKKVVMRMLDSNQLNRPNAQIAISYLEMKNVVPPELQNGGFYYCAINGTNRFIKMKDQMPGLFDGVVVEASQVPKDEAKRIKIRYGLKTVLIDPQAYLFQFPKHQSKKFKGLSYYEHKNLFSDMPLLLQKIKERGGDIINFLNEIVGHQLNAGATAIIPPFLYIDEFNNDAWSIDQEITYLALDILSNYRNVKPFVKGVAMSQEILTSDRSRNKILEYLTSLSDRVEGYIILLDSSHSTVVSDEPWLKGAQDLFTKLLSTGKYVIWSKADFSGIALAPLGVSIATGEMLKQRRFNVIEDKQSQARKVPCFYLPAMFARATWPEALNILSEYEKFNDLVCQDACCSAVDFSSPAYRKEGDLAGHMMLAVGKQYGRYKGGSGKVVLVEDIKKAKQHYESLKNHSNLLVREGLRKNIKPSSSLFLDSWLNTLNR